MDTRPFIEHIHELRGRLFWIVTTLLLSSLVTYQFRDQLVQIVVAPLHGSKLIYLNPGGGFTFIFTISLYLGAILTIPVVVYHLYRFLQPIIKRPSRYLIIGVITTSILLAASGVAFGYLLVIPGAIHFLGEFAGKSIVPNLTTDAYLNFVVLHLFGMAALFQLPLLLFISDHIRPFPPGTLLRLQRWVIAGSIIVAAIITPTPDPLNLALVAVPVIAIYELGVVVVWLRRRLRSIRRDKQPSTQPIATTETKAKLSVIRTTPSEIIKPEQPTVVNNTAYTSQDVRTAKKPAAYSKSIDGFSARRMSRTIVAIPPARAEPIRPARQQTIFSAPQQSHQRSIDGFSMV